MISLLHSAYKLRRGQGGVIALATFTFVISMGAAMIVSLWGIGYVSGAFNTLYTSNQAAAYAAATVTANGTPGTELQQQAVFACTQREGAFGTTCVEGEALDAAEQVLAQSLPANTSRNFGLFFDPNSSSNAMSQVHMVAVNGNYSGEDQIQLYEMPYSPATLRAYVNVFGGGGCSPPSNRDYDTVKLGPPQSFQPTIISCWRLSEFGQQFPAQYQSAVVIRSAANVPLLPFCAGTSWCPTQKLVVAAAATQDQPAPPSNYGQYYNP